MTVYCHQHNKMIYFESCIKILMVRSWILLSRLSARISHCHCHNAAKKKKMIFFQAFAYKKQENKGHLMNIGQSWLTYFILASTDAKLPNASSQETNWMKSEKFFTFFLRKQVNFFFRDSTKVREKWKR